MSASPASVLRRMEQLVSHLLDELTAIRQQQQQQQQQQAREQEQQPSQPSKQKVEGGKKEEEQVKQEQQQGDKATEAEAAGAASASSARPSDRRRGISRRVKPKDTVIIQYQPAESNSSRDEHGVLQYHLPAQADEPQVKEEHGSAAAAASTATALLPSSRWAATPPAAARRKRKNNSSNSGTIIPGSKRVHGNGGRRDSGSQQQICRKEEGGSQQMKDEAEGSQTTEAAAASEEQQDGNTRVKSRQLVYPSRNGHRQLAALLKHMSSCYLKIQRSYKANIRELFYDDKPLFKSKAYSDSSIHLLCSILQLQRDELSLVSSAKGLIMGDLQFELEDFADPDANESAHPAIQRVNCEAGQTITPYVKQIRGFQCGATWLLLVEKDTVFSKIAQSGFPMLRNCLLVTDKGMPTISTRKFLKLLHTAFPDLPMWGVFDADPAGVGIYSEYKHGSARSVSEELALPQLQWLGLSLRDAERLGVLQRSKLKLTAKDRTRIHNLLAGVAQHDDDMRRELESMLALDCKAEIECVSQLGDDFLTAAYIPDKMEQLRLGAEAQAAAAATEAAPATAPPNQSHQEANIGSVVGGAATAAAAGVKLEPRAPSIPQQSIFGELQLDDLSSLHGHASAAAASGFGSAFPVESLEDDDLLAVFGGGAAAAANDGYEENQWFA